MPNLHLTDLIHILYLFPLRHFSILSFHLSMYTQNDVFPSGFMNEIFYINLSHMLSVLHATSP